VEKIRNFETLQRFKTAGRGVRNPGRASVSRVTVATVGMRGMRKVATRQGRPLHRSKRRGTDRMGREAKGKFSKGTVPEPSSAGHAPKQPLGAGGERKNCCRG